MDMQRLKNFVGGIWDESVVPSITDYIKIPNKSPAFDADWQKHGYMADPVKLMERWGREGDRLFGRGPADDGYAIYAAISALLALHDQQAPHARCVILIEACEES